MTTTQIYWNGTCCMTRIWYLEPDEYRIMQQRMREIETDDKTAREWLKTHSTLED